jgi:hypothetical protein
VVAIAFPDTILVTALLALIVVPSQKINSQEVPVLT